MRLCEGPCGMAEVPPIPSSEPQLTNGGAPPSPPLQNGYAACNGCKPLPPDSPQHPEPQPQFKPTDDVPAMGTHRSASDGAVRDGVWSSRDGVPARVRSHSDSDEQVAGLRARICQRFEQLDAERAAAGSASSGSTEGPDDFCSPMGEPREHMHWCGLPSPRPRSVSVAEVKELAYGRLQAELSKAQQELKLKDEEVARLSQIRDEVGAELEELTASLFEEANNMVREANMKQAAAEKRLRECNLKTEVLQAEVAALKALVLTSTPSRPNTHLHPQLGPRRHRRSPSNYELGGRPPSPAPLATTNGTTPPTGDDDEACEVDPVYHQEFVSWRQNPSLDPKDPFLSRIYKEDILPCLHFASQQLSEEVLKSIEENCITIEAVTGSNPFPKKCCLLDAPRLCKYRMRLGDSSSWHYISQLSRNRITSVCDLFCYLRYIQQGLVRNSIHEVYWEVIRRRRRIALARLGIGSPAMP